MAIGFREALKKGLQPIYSFDKISKTSVKKKLKKIAKKNGLKYITEAKIKGLKV